jgi:hypothetical protein
MHLFAIQAFLVVACLVYGTVLLVQRYLRLRHVPGPIFAKFTDFWLFYQCQTVPHSRDLFFNLDKRYGPVFRYGPNRVMINELAAVSVVHGSRDVFEKVRSSAMLASRIVTDLDRLIHTT